MNAKNIVNKLNTLISNNDVRKDIQTLIDSRIACSNATADSDNVIVLEENGKYFFGVLGLLNGLLDGEIIMAVFDDNTQELKEFIIK